jgi:glycosyltransferase involved in cell wall biosynthesis
VSASLIAEAMLREGWDVHVVFGFSGPFESIMQAAGCTTEVIEHQSWLRSSSITHFPRHWWRERKRSHDFDVMIRRQRPDAVYVNSLVSLAAAISSKRLGVPCVWHLRECFSDQGGEIFAPRLLGKSIVKRVIGRLASRIHTCSPYVSREIMGDIQANALAIPNAVSDECFRHSAQGPARQKLGLPADRCIVGVPGTLRPVKGHLFFLRGAQKLCREYPECVFAISGDLSAPFAQNVISRAHDLGIYEKCFFLDQVTDMAAFYAACDFTCVPSVAETFGRTVIESFASKRAVVAADVGGIPDIIDDECTGILIPYGDDEALAAALRRLVVDQDLRIRLALAGRQMAESRYSEAKHARQVVDSVRHAVRKFR